MSFFFIHHRFAAEIAEDAEKLGMRFSATCFLNNFNTLSVFLCVLCDLCGEFLLVFAHEVWSAVFF